MHTAIIKADSKEQASNIAGRMAEMSKSYVTITDGPFIDDEQIRQIEVVLDEVE